MNHVLYRPPVRIVLATLTFYAEEHNIILIPIPDLISIDFMYRAAIAIHEEQPIPRIVHGEALNLVRSVRYLIRDMENSLQLIAAINDPDEALYRTGLRFAFRLEFEIYDQIDRNHQRNR